jgi:3-hydroxyisobutyrate dehydrogenase-like beta-hydroxyacid dehydrogenase
MPARQKKRTVGIVGLGIMGGAFAKNLAAAGWRVIGYDISAARCREASRRGVSIADDVKELVRAAPVLITSLPHPRALETTVRGVIDAHVSRRTIVEASTFAIEDKAAAERQLSAAGHVMLDCPVSGTGAQARTKDLVFYASGNKRAIAKLRPMFAVFSRHVYDLGEFGNGSRIKYVANLLVAIHNVASAEAMVLGMKAGLDPKQIMRLISVGAGNSRVFELRAPMMAKNRYSEATMKISVWQKDMKVIGDFAASLGCPTPLFNATFPLYAAAMSTGHASHDTAAVCAVLESMAGYTRGRARKKRR